ncbi:MAG TPA: hypothetical protein VJI75_00605 [Candidatus Nanoarchaeia archaeon]|nr:hypothetical protein [Candidatus Nanoarchaeia archaeon]
MRYSTNYVSALLILTSFALINADSQPKNSHPKDNYQKKENIIGTQNKQKPYGNDPNNLYRVKELAKMRKELGKKHSCVGMGMSILENKISRIDEAAELAIKDALNVCNTLPKGKPGSIARESLKRCAGYLSSDVTYMFVCNK